MKPNYLLVSFLCMAALACLSPSPPSSTPPPTDPERSIIGVSVTVLNPPFASENRPRVYFVRIEEGDAMSQQHVIPSNYWTDHYAYLVDAPPGLYAAVLAARHNPNFGSGVGTPDDGLAGLYEYFSEDLIRKTIVEVGPSTIAFMGEFVVADSASGYLTHADADAAQKHYQRLLGLHLMDAIDPTTALLLGRIGQYATSERRSDKSANARERFLTETKNVLSGSGWDRVVGQK